MKQIFKQNMAWIFSQIICWSPLYRMLLNLNKEYIHELYFPRVVMGLYSVISYSVLWANCVNLQISLIWDGRSAQSGAGHKMKPLNIRAIKVWIIIIIFFFFYNELTLGFTHWNEITKNGTWREWVPHNF